MVKEQYINCPMYLFPTWIMVATLLFAFTGCVVTPEKDYKEFFNKSHSGNIIISINSVDIDTLLLDLEGKDYSFVSQTGIYQDSIYLIDQLTSNVFIFNKEGKYIASKLGRGRGPSEIETSGIDGFCFLRNGHKVFISDINMFTYDQSWNIIDKGIIDWFGKVNYSEIRNITDPLPDEPALYGFEFEKLKILSSNLNDDLIFAPVYSEHSDFNGFVSDSYYTQGRIQATIDVSKRKLINLKGRRSPEYLKNKYLGHYSFYAMEVGPEDDFYVSHEIDSMIYHYDNSFNLIHKFGYSGRGMDTKYTAVKSFDLKRIQKLYFEERPTKGYYDEVFYLAEKDIFLRSYKRGVLRKNDGLQIYHGFDLIGDIDVPKGFKILGYIEPYFYSASLNDEEKMTSKIFRFKLN